MGLAVQVAFGRIGNTRIPADAVARGEGVPHFHAVRTYNTNEEK